MSDGIALHRDAGEKRKFIPQARQPRVLQGTNICFTRGLVGRGNLPQT